MSIHTEIVWIEIDFQNTGVNLLMTLHYPETALTSPFSKSQTSSSTKQQNQLHLLPSSLKNQSWIVDLRCSRRELWLLCWLLQILYILITSSHGHMFKSHDNQKNRSPRLYLIFMTVFIFMFLLLPCKYWFKHLCPLPNPYHLINSGLRMNIIGIALLLECTTNEGCTYVQWINLF